MSGSRNLLLLGCSSVAIASKGEMILNLRGVIHGNGLLRRLFNRSSSNPSSIEIHYKWKSQSAVQFVPELVVSHYGIISEAESKRNSSSYLFCCKLF